MRVTFFLPLAAVTSLLAFAPSAHAEDPAIPPPPPVEAPDPMATAPSRAEVPPPSPPLTRSGLESHWYGWETLIVDGASLSLLTAAAGSENGAQAPFALGGVAGFSLGAPIVHAAHGRWAIAAADVAMRVGGVFLGGLIGTGVGAATCPRAESSGFLGCLGSDTDGMVVGAIGGALAASALDASLLAREKVKPAETQDAAFTWSPSVRLVHEGAVVGVGGTF